MSDDERARMVAGDPYDPTDEALVAARREARRLTRAYNRSDPDADRRAVLSELFGSVGESVHIEPPFRCDYGFNVHLGASVYANFGCVFLDVCPIDVGDGVMLGPGVHVYTASHPIDPDDRLAGREFGAGVDIGDRVWIGGQAVLTPGVSVGDEAVVAAGAVVTEDVPERTVVGGNPARVIRDIG